MDSVLIFAVLMVVSQTTSLADNRLERRCTRIQDNCPLSYLNNACLLKFQKEGTQ